MAELPSKHAIIPPGILSDTLFLRAEIYGNMKKYEKALLDLEKALKEAPADWKDFKKARTLKLSHKNLLNEL
ncbi:MAG: tetratricopeptide repeat protein [Elusimicrobiota bacterium]|nr:tetratricopeptide repeat protein [Elusimicrobiota bacterium]